MTGDTKSLDRRAFLAGAGAFLVIKPERVRGSQRNSAVRMGLLGCGGRGTGVATSFTEETSAQYVALADLFQEQTERAQKSLGQAAGKKGKPGVGSSMLFHGPQCLERLLAAKDVDCIHIATPPYFHPQHFEACAAASRHVYLEKPVAVDVPGAKRVMRAGDKRAAVQRLRVTSH